MATSRNDACRCDSDGFSRRLRDPGRADVDRAQMQFAVGEVMTSASQLNDADPRGHRSVHHTSGGSGRHIYMEQCLPVVHKQGSASSVGSVASSTKLSAISNAANRSSRCPSSSSDIANSSAQHDEVSISILSTMSGSRHVISNQSINQNL